MSTVTSVDIEQIKLAVDLLSKAELVGMPTETVYGLAGDAASDVAIQKIFDLKGRPAKHPVIVHVAGIDQLPLWAKDISNMAYALAEAFWPGPLTLILHKQASVSSLITGGQSSVGVRIPAHPTALALLKAFGRGLAAPSANRFGRVSPTRAAHVRDEFGVQVPLVLDGGSCTLGIESTIVDVRDNKPNLLRLGQITAEQMSDVLNFNVTSGLRDESPRVSGALDQHYAPRTPTELVLRSKLEAWLNAQRFAGQRVLVLAIKTLPVDAQGLVLPKKCDDYARGLYAALRELDQCQVDRIAVECPPTEHGWEAIHDRLNRATFR